MIKNEEKKIKLQIINEKLSNNFNEKEKIMPRYDELLKMPEVQEALSLTNKIQILSMERNQLISEFMEINKKYCSHPLWYRIQSETDEFEGRTYYTCRCVECGTILEERDYYFKGKIIITKIPYKNIHEIYNKYMQTYQLYKSKKNEEIDYKLLTKTIIKHTK